MYLANENFPRPGTILLREHGHTIHSIQEDTPGISDEEVISIASQNNLVILTFDRDYGELIFKYAIHNPPAVIYFREKGNTPLFAGQTLLKLLSEAALQFEKAFTVIEETNIRQRFY